MNRVNLLSMALLALMGFHFNNSALNHKLVESNQTISASKQSQGGSFKREIDIFRSIIEWKGTKLLGTGKHNGILKILEGELFYVNDILSGGFVIADMKSITVTDIPKSDPIPYQNLTTHLNSDFNVLKYPVARFEIVKVEAQNSVFVISGEMIIMDIARNVSLIAKSKDGFGESYEARLIFDRTFWNIGNEGSWFEKKLVDDEIELIIHLFLK